MKFSLSLLFFVFSLPLLAQNSSANRMALSPLSLYGNEWNDAKYAQCNTAAKVDYLTSDEKRTIYILNLLRYNPSLFVKTVLVKYPSLSGKGYLTDDTYYYQSLIKTLGKLEPLTMLYPDKKCFESAKCHATSSGLIGYVGHERKTNACKPLKSYNGECCDYGNEDPLDIVLALLIDEGIPNLGHRNVFLTNYTKLGVSIQPHKKYGTNAVFDFSF